MADSKNRKMYLLVIIHSGMKRNKIAFVLAMIAGVLCLSAFIYRYVRSKEIDATILFAGVFIVSYGYGVSRRNRND